MDTQKGSVASAIPVEGEFFDFHGVQLFAARENRCHFCPREERESGPPTVSFIAESRDRPVWLHAQLEICVRHLRELADEAERALE